MKPYTVQEEPIVAIIHEEEVLIRYNPFAVVHAKANAKILNGAFAKGIMTVMGLLESEGDKQTCMDIIKEVLC